MILMNNYFDTYFNPKTIIIELIVNSFPNYIML